MPENGNGPYLLTVWTGGGAHNHTLLIFDLSLAPRLQDYKAIVHYYTSSWNIYLFPTTENVEIFGERMEYYPNDVEPLKEGIRCDWKTQRVDGQFRLDCGRPEAVSKNYFYERWEKLKSRQVPSA